MLVINLLNEPVFTEKFFINNDRVLFFNFYILTINYWENKDIKIIISQIINPFKTAKVLSLSANDSILKLQQQ